MINISQFKVQYLQLIYKNLKYQTKNRCNAFLLLEYLGFRKSGGNYSMKQLCHSLKWLNGKHWRQSIIIYWTLKSPLIQWVDRFQTHKLCHHTIFYNIYVLIVLHLAPHGLEPVFRKFLLQRKRKSSHCNRQQNQD